MVKINLKNKNEVKNYLVYTLSSNKFIKSNVFFKRLINLFNTHPKLIKQIIDNLNNFTYFKDYLKILFMSKNKVLNDYIYDLLLNQLKMDIESVDKGKISTLAKWLPRKGSHYDKKLNFVNIFAEKLFPKEKNRIKLFIKYKKMIVMLTKIINPIEINLCAKSYDDIDNITKRNMITYQRKIQKDENLDKINEEMINQILGYSYDKLCARIIWLNGLNDFKKNIYKNEINFINQLFLNNFKKLIIDYDFSDRILVLDISSDLLEKSKKSIIKIAIASLYINKFIIINGNFPIKLDITNDIFSNVKNIISSFTLTKNINIIEINKIIENKNFIIVSPKSVNNIKYSDQDICFIEYKNHLLKHIKNNKNMIIYQGDPLYYEYKSKKLVLIEKIFSDNPEFNEEKKTFSMLCVLLILATLVFGIYYFI